MVMVLGSCQQGGIEGTDPGGQQVWSSHLLGHWQIGPLEAVFLHMEDSFSHPVPRRWGWFNSHSVMHLCKALWYPGEGPLQSHRLLCNLAAQAMSATA